LALTGVSTRNPPIRRRTNSDKSGRPACPRSDTNQFSESISRREIITRDIQLQSHVFCNYTDRLIFQSSSPTKLNCNGFAIVLKQTGDHPGMQWIDSHYHVIIAQDGSSLEIITVSSKAFIMVS
jgi:hypothetical protein